MFVSPKGPESPIGVVRCSAAHVCGKIVEAAEVSADRVGWVVVGSFETGRSWQPFKKGRTIPPRPLVLVLRDFLTVPSCSYETAAVVFPASLLKLDSSRELDNARFVSLGTQILQASC